MKISIFIISLFCIIIISCKKPVSYPITPSIKYERFELKDTIDALGNNQKYGMLSFSFVDGDGDFGLSEGDTIYPYSKNGPYYYNLFITMFSKTDGIFDTVKTLVPLNYRMPYYVVRGQNKTLKGEIKTALIFDLPLAYDSIKYSFYIYDRDLHKSNVETTPELILKN